jgi:hypothetical protein
MPCVIGIDLSLTSTGIATVIDGHVTSILRVVSKGKKDDTLPMRWQRLDLIREADRGEGRAAGPGPGGDRGAELRVPVRPPA